MENLFHIIESVADVVRVQEDIAKTDVIALDIESTGFDFRDDTLLLIQFRINDTTYLIENQKLPEKVTRYILELLDMSGKPVIAHNAKFDIKFIYENYGILFRNVYCTMISEYLITEAREKFASYQELCFKYLGEIIEKDTVKKFVGAEGKEITQDMLIYGATDVLFLKEIRELQLPLLKEKHLETVHQLEMDVVPVVAGIESHGVLIDVDGWMELYTIALDNSTRLDKEIKLSFWEFCRDNIIPANQFLHARDVLEFWFITFKKTKTEKKRLEEITIDQLVLIEKEFIEHINLASPKQMRRAFNLMGAGVDSTAEKVLISLAKKYPVAELMLEFRKNYKRVTTYGLEFIEKVKEDGRIYARFNQIGTATGRFSSRDPNLQNIIAGSEYRKCFIAPEGKKLITADYSQQEFRLAGELSGEPAIIEAYQKGMDMHTATASILYDIPLEEVTKEQRTRGKTVNFAVLYGSSSYGLARTMGISNEEAEKLLERFQEGFPRLSSFQKSIQKTVWKLRYSVTPIGRRRGFAKNALIEGSTGASYYKERGKIDREGFNHIVQGGSADMLKYALLMMYNDNPWKDKFKIVMTVHDEIVAEVDDDIVEEAKEFMVSVMKKAGEIFMKQIPTEVGIQALPYWSK